MRKEIWISRKQIEENHRYGILAMCIQKLLANIENLGNEVVSIPHDDFIVLRLKNPETNND